MVAPGGNAVTQTLNQFLIPSHRKYVQSGPLIHKYTTSLARALEPKLRCRRHAFDERLEGRPVRYPMIFRPRTKASAASTPTVAPRQCASAVTALIDRGWGNGRSSSA